MTFIRLIRTIYSWSHCFLLYKTMKITINLLVQIKYTAKNVKNTKQSHVIKLFYHIIRDEKQMELVLLV